MSAWVPGDDERYHDPPVTGSLVEGVLGRPLRVANDASNAGIERNADGYVYDGLSLLRPKEMRKRPVVEPLAPALAEAIAEAAKRQAKGK